METRAGQPPEGRLIEEARERLDISQNEAAKRAGMSGTRWRQITYGEASGGPGIKNPVHGNPETIAKMAHVVEVTVEQLEEVGREDAARVLAGFIKAETHVPELVLDDPHLHKIIKLWPQTVEWQRRAFVGFLEQMINESPESTGKPDQGQKRRTG